MASEDVHTDLRSVMFLAGACDWLLHPSDGYRQLDGVLELLEFANTYVLSDRIAIGGSPPMGHGEISGFIANLADQTDAIEFIGESPRYQFDLRHYEDRPRMASLSRRIDKLDLAERSREPNSGREGDEAKRRRSDERERCFDKLNLLVARAYILLADANSAAYVPDRIFGVRALEGYPEALSQSTQLREHETFRRQLVEQLRSRPEEVSVETRVPSFLLDALHAASTWQGAFSALTDMRLSAAAQQYRDLVHRSGSPDLNERREARIELTRNSRSAFEREGLSGGSNRWIVPTVGLSAAAIAFLFPDAGVIAGLVAAVPPVIGSIRDWQRERNNFFEFYNRPLDYDLYDELTRIFPKIKFRSENLQHFLSKRDFGWSENLNWWRDVRLQRARSK
jgi:hypothetical protein